MNFLLLVSLPPGVATVTRPVVAQRGTVAVMYVSYATLNFAGVPLKETLVVPVNPGQRFVWFCHLTRALRGQKADEERQTCIQTVERTTAVSVRPYLLERLKKSLTART